VEDQRIKLGTGRIRIFRHGGHSLLSCVADQEGLTERDVETYVAQDFQRNVRSLESVGQLLKISAVEFGEVSLAWDGYV
jgi:hypothetical protein